MHVTGMPSHKMPDRVFELGGLLPITSLYSLVQRAMARDSILQ